MNKHITIVAAAFLGLIALVSCQSVAHGDSDPSLPQFTVEQHLPASADSAQPVTSTETNRPRLNPPHGQPGHDCNIAVGEPLGMTPSFNASSIVSPAPAMSVPAGTSARLNPPHGQPGHVCEVPVGQPLP